MQLLDFLEKKPVGAVEVPIPDPKLEAIRRPVPDCHTLRLMDVGRIAAAVLKGMKG